MAPLFFLERSGDSSGFVVYIELLAHSVACWVFVFLVFSNHSNMALVF